MRLRQEQEIISHRFNKAIAVAALLTVGAVCSGCSHPADPATTATAVPAPTAAGPAQDALGASSMAPEDQETIKHNQNKGQGPPP